MSCFLKGVLYRFVKQVISEGSQWLHKDLTLLHDQDGHSDSFRINVESEVPRSSSKKLTENSFLDSQHYILLASSMLKCRYLIHSVWFSSLVLPIWIRNDSAKHATRRIQVKTQICAMRLSWSRSEQGK